MSAVSFDAAVQAVAGRPRSVPPGGRRVQLCPLQLEGRQLGGATASLEEPLQEEEQEGGTKTGEEEEEEEEKGDSGSVRAVQQFSLCEDFQHCLTKRSPTNT